MKAGSSGDTSAIERLIGRARIRIRSQWALEGATTATVLAAAAALAIVFGLRTEALAPTTGVLLLVCAGGLILAGALVSALRPLDDESVARRIDRASNLSDRLSTAIAFRRALAAKTAETADDETTEMMLAAIRDGARAVPRANVRAATPIVAPEDWRAALGFLAISALAAGLALPGTDRTPRIYRVDPDHARPGEVVTLVGANLTTGVVEPLAAIPAARSLGAAGVPPEATAAPAPVSLAASGGRVFLGRSENPYVLEREMRAIADRFAGAPATRELGEALRARDLDRARGEKAKLQLATGQDAQFEHYEQLATRLAGNRPVAVLEWTRTAIRIRIPADAPFGETTLTAYLGDRTLGPVAFTVVDPKDSQFHGADSVQLDPDERAYIDGLLAELRDLAQRDAIEDLEKFADRIQDLLRQVEEGKITKEQLLTELAKAEEEMKAGAEPDQAGLDKQMAELGKELAKQELTKDLGKALEQNQLDKAKQELEKLAARLDPKELEQQKQDLQKKLEDPKLNEQQKQEIQKQLEQLNQQKPLTEQQKQDLQKQLEKTAQQMQKQQDQQQKQQQQQRQKLEDEVRRLQKEKQDAKTEKEQLDAERRLQKKQDELKRLQKDQDERNQSAQRDAIKRLHKDIEKAAEQLEKPKDKQESQEEQEQRERQASQKIKDAARETGRVDQDKRKQTAQKKMSTQMDDLREAMQRAKQKGNKGPQDPFNKQGKNRDFAQRARGGKGQSQAWRPGQGQGQGQGQQGQQGQGQGQQGPSEPGVGHDPNLTGDPTAKSGNTKDQDLQGTQGGKGASRRETILAAAQKGFASTGYKKVYADYQKIVEEVMRNEKLPSSYKYYVKRYFAKIHPSAGLDVESIQTPQEPTP